MSVGRETAATRDPYSAEAMEAAGWRRMLVTRPFGLSGAMYRVREPLPLDSEGDETMEVWIRGQG